MALALLDTTSDIVETLIRSATNRGDLWWRSEAIDPRRSDRFYTIGCRRCGESKSISHDALNVEARIIPWNDLGLDCRCLRSARDEQAWLDHFGVLAEAWT